MPNYAQAAIQLRQNKERRAKERGSRRQPPGDKNDTTKNDASAIQIKVILGIKVALIYSVFVMSPLVLQDLCNITEKIEVYDWGRQWNQKF